MFTGVVFSLLPKFWICAIPFLGTLTALLVRKVERPMLERWKAEGLVENPVAGADFCVMTAVMWPIALLVCVVVLVLRWFKKSD